MGNPDNAAMGAIVATYIAGEAVGAINLGESRNSSSMDSWSAELISKPQKVLLYSQEDSHPLPYQFPARNW